MLVRPCMCLCVRVWASPALAATSAAVMFCSFWRIRNVSAGPTTLATQSHGDTYTHRFDCNSKTCNSPTHWHAHDGVATWCWWNCWLSGVSYQRVAPTASLHHTNSDDYKRTIKSLFFWFHEAFTWQHFFWEYIGSPERGVLRVYYINRRSESWI